MLVGGSPSVTMTIGGTTYTFTPRQITVCVQDPPGVWNQRTMWVLGTAPA